MRRGGGDRAAYWRGVLREQAASGLSIAAFCRERGVAPASFFCWRRRLSTHARPDPHAAAEARRRGGQWSKPSAGQFVAVNVPPPTTSLPPSLPDQSPRLEVILSSGTRLLVHDQCDAAWLQNILAVIEGSSC